MANSPMRDAWIELALGLDGNLAITLGAGLSTTPATLERSVTAYFNRIQRQALGPRWTKADARDRISAIGFCEHIDSNLHMHVFAKAGDRCALKLMLGQRLWKSVRTAGDYYCEPIQDPMRYARYITKELGSAASFDRIFVYKPRE